MFGCVIDSKRRQSRFIILLWLLRWHGHVSDPCEGRESRQQGEILCVVGTQREQGGRERERTDRQAGRQAGR